MTQTTQTCALGRHRCTPRNLTEAVHCVARHSGIDAHHLADQLEIDYATFIRWTEPNGVCQMPGRKFAQLAQVTGRFEHIAWIAADAGLVIASKVKPESASDRLRELLDIAEQVGRLAGADRDASADGVLDNDERIALKGIVQRAMRELTEYEQAIG